jgi:hypothetical protein
MGSFRLVILLVLGILYFLGGHVLSALAMKHFKGPEQSPWLESPLVDSSLFSDEGKQIIRMLRIYYVVAGLLLLGVGVILNRIG